MNSTLMNFLLAPGSSERQLCAATIAPISYSALGLVEVELLQDAPLPSSFDAVRSSCASEIQDLLFPADSTARDGAPIRSFPRSLWSHGVRQIPAFRSSGFRLRL